jgi:phosphoglycerate dehydrogenase-like enzyme
VTTIPAKNDLVIHFAHPAYQFEACLKGRGIDLNTFQTWTREDTAKRIGEGHVMVVTGFWNNGYIEAGSNLGFIQACGAGYNQFDLDGLAARGIRFCNASGVNVNAVSDHAMALMLGIKRKIHLARDNQRAKHWRGMIADIPSREDELAGKTLVIYGMGAIGSRLARLAKAFEMTVIGVRRNVDAIKGLVDEAHAPDAFPELLGRADFVALTCPLTDETANVMNADTFAAMRPGAHLINVARGGCVDEPALIEALRAGTIAGAGIDTTVVEPLDAASPLWDMDNIILTPHTAGETQMYEENVVDILLENLERLWRGETELHNQIV